MIQKLLYYNNVKRNGGSFLFMEVKELIKEIDRLSKALLEEVDDEDLTDYAREHAYYSLVGARDFLEENYE